MPPETSSEVQLVNGGGSSPSDGKAAPVDTSVDATLDEQVPWRPWPWNYFPDNLCISFSWLLLSFVGPPMAILIGSAEVTWKLLQGIYFRVEALQRIRQRILDVAEVAGKYVLRDPRDFSYLPWMLWLSLYCPFILYYFYQRHDQHGFEWTMFLLYHFLRIGPRFRFFAHTHVLQHKEGHDHHGLFRGPWRVFNHVIQFWVGQFYGQVPNSYGIAHNKIHHRWHNDLEDVHTNLDLDRTQFRSFLIYLPRFAVYWTGISPLLLFVQRREWRFAAKMFKGMVIYYGLTAMFYHLNPTFCLMYWLFPHFESMIFFGGISYLWHAWVDPEDPTNQYINSVTILNGFDNIWNEDYHVVHHHSPQTHWSEVPDHYQKHVHVYEKQRATIFENTEEGEMLYWMFSGQWNELAKHFVDLSGKMTEAEKYDLLMTRLKFVVNRNGGRKAFVKQD
mmetsp:Transcript_8934/g.27658  ORF Transcript_8934/g.27658 Transcript_8934/m.27658 type:complete len:446 (-) Transcript_8934:60-1397(-)|eukprot:CAMPEP_0177643176 /NCGR_PEP_ID=MMETSP0447-20121125/8018_1 /TAXON_ID=0 /ORGANISM="Stygamoeba regulata, Strain BSH-02190019" /LENGTH=445 /DNA_ID=CAMNT_0019145459 /DNA_START=155 /DNA_END=1492 /DNA_ORIENTATION=+